jgi:thioredoxin reductase (NADPH)
VKDPSGGVLPDVAVTLRNVKTGAIQEMTADGVFIAIGHSPSTELVAGKIKMKPNGYVWTAPYSTATSVPGLFAAGDVTDDIYRQAVTAAGMGCMAALEAVRFLAEQDHAKAKHPISHEEAQKIGAW